ncbi:unnamed protein product, partial [Polarella glacialis]
VGQRLTGYLQSCGLEAEDVPKVAGLLLTAKYLTWGTSVAVAFRFHPLRRIFLSRREALFGAGMATLRPWAQRRRLWLVEALDAAQRRGDANFSKASALIAARRATGATKATNFATSTVLSVRARRRSAAAAAVAAASRNVGKLRMRFHKAVSAAQRQYAAARARYRAAKCQWNFAGWQLLRRQERHRLGIGAAKQQRASRESVRIGWFAWTSARYWQLSDKLEAAAGSNRAWTYLTSRLKIDPKGSALGLAEGTILFKCTFPLHMPLMLLLIVQAFKQRRFA